MTTNNHPVELSVELGTYRVARQVLGELGVTVPAAVASRVAQQIRALVDSQVRVERERCVLRCRERADLWRNTRAASAPVAYVREESRARANEATYLADLLLAGD